MQSKYQDKARGMMVGLAVGDALGAPIQFLPDPSDFYIEQMGNKIESFHDNYRAPKGVWTDDTEMALCIADSILEKKGYDSYDIMQKFCDWCNKGYRTYDGQPAVDVGTQVLYALQDYNDYKVIPKDTIKTESAGNGAIMRLAPIVIANTFPKKKYPTLKDAHIKEKLVINPEDEKKEFIDNKDIKPTLRMSVLSCRETHNSIAAEAVTEMFATTLYCALHGLEKNNIATYSARWLTNAKYDNFWLNNIGNLLDRSFEKEGTKLHNLGGYIVDTFAIAIWGLINFKTFEDGMMAVLKLGGDADTNGAVYGQLAGTYYGFSKIPKKWRDEVFKAKELVEIADKLLKMPKCPIIRTRFEDDDFFEDIK